MMLSKRRHLVGVTVGVAGTSFAAEFGFGPLPYIAYGVAVALGSVLYLQGDLSATEGPIFGNVLIGYLAGIAVSLLGATALLILLLGIPWDLAVWQLGVQFWDSWAGVGVALLSGFFLTGVLAAVG